MDDVSHDKCAGNLAESYRRAAQQTTMAWLRVPIEGKVIVSTIKVVAPGYDESVIMCPHGVRFWAAPDAAMQQFLERAFEQTDIPD
jgi:hypothetical protein